MLVKKILFGTQYLTSDQIYNNMKEKKKYDAFLQGGGQKKLPHRQNDLPHRPLILCSICLMTMITLMENSLNSRSNFEKKGQCYVTRKDLTYLPI